jgi:hypothetical protein
MGWAALFVLTMGAFRVSDCRADFYTGSTISDKGHVLLAAADLRLQGNTLTVTLYNFSPQNYTNADKATANDVLTGLLFSMSPSASVTLDQATVSPHSELINWDSANGPAPTNLNGIVTPGGWVASARGIATTAFGMFDKDLTNAGVGRPGFNYGIISQTYDLGDGNKALNETPLVQNSITFTLTVGKKFALSNIESVTFQFGSNRAGPSIEVARPALPQEVVPEPSSVALALAGVVPIGLWLTRQSNRRRSVH